MGWFYRRSAKFGPFRLNFSKSGIGVSTGIKGARISTGPRGTYVNLGSSGLYYRQKISGSHSGASSSRAAAQPIPSYAQKHLTSLPGSLNYPSFPKQGLPRIVTTLALLAVPVLLLSIFILAVIGIATSSSSTPSISANKSQSPTEPVGSKSAETKREQGYQAGYDYCIQSSNSRTQRPDQRSVKKLAAKAAAKEHQDQEWQLGWIAGYNKAFELAAAATSSSVNSSVAGQATSRQAATTTFQPSLRSTSNGYIRGSRGGCYYLSASGRKVYVDRGMCN